VAHLAQESERFHPRRQRIRGLIHLGRFSEAEAELEALDTHGRAAFQRHRAALASELAERRTAAAEPVQ